MLVSSKYKQMYECRLPAQAVRFHQDGASEPDSQGYTGPSIPDLLKPMHTAPCLVKAKDWWTYEFCYGQHIRQYHLEDTGVKGDVFFPGYFDSEFDWINETAKAGEDAFDNQLTDNEVTEDAFGDETFNFKVITDPADLMKFVQNLKESNRKKAQNEAEREALRKEKERRGAEDEEERLLLQEFDEEIAGLSVPSANIEEMKEEMQKKFDNIIDEQELDTEGLKGEFDRTQATQTFETTLDKLLNHLEDKDAGDTEAEHLTEGGQKANDPARGSPSLAPQQPEIPPTSCCPTYTCWEGTSVCLSCLVTPNQATDDHVQIRVTKYKTSGSPDGEVEVQEMGEGDLKWQHIKDMVKGQLEKAGLKAEGQIEVKILTPRTAEDQWLTEEDTKSFRELLINLLTGGTDGVYK
ncbi:protein OS-9-like [Oncorhynchus mykiss]|uniref:protein OS-9-like n=1 Tax=Oncorhynchus mykiss TaxID=8022 RepID=UPI00187783BC|nr:protein OS-9-like [Oncorhynchus mykiss]